MSTDAIQQVTDSERQAREIRTQAQAEAQNLLAEARKSAQAAQAEARKAAQEQVRQRLGQAEVRAGKESEKVLAEFDADCQALKDRAAERLNKAAALIVRRVVEN